jgi:flagellar basal body P-ring formation protein FlgA
MMSFRVFFIFWSIGFFISTPAQAEVAYESPLELQHLAAQVLQEQVTAQQADNKSPEDIEINVLPLDARLRLSRCNQAIEHSVTLPTTGSGQASVKLFCNGTTRWSLFAPAQVTRFGEVAVATRSLGRGDILQPGDIRFVRQNISQIGPNYIDAPTRALGLELKRPLREGETLRLSYLESPKIVQRGDAVALEAQTQGLSVTAPGTAMANGHVGERIRVRNTQSDRIVDALVIAPGRVRVKY